MSAEKKRKDRGREMKAGGEGREGGKAMEIGRWKGEGGKWREGTGEGEDL